MAQPVHAVPCRHNGHDGLSPWAVCLAHTFQHSQLTAIRRTFDLAFAPGRYEVRGRRTSDSTAADGRTMDVVQWESAKAFLPGSLSYDQSGVAVKIQSTNALSQNAANKFSVIQTRKLPLYDRAAQAWTAPQPTRSYAAAMSHIIKAEYGGNRRDKQIDLDVLWGVIQPELSKRSWNFDCWIDGPYDVWQLIVELSQAYLVMPRLHGTVVSFSFDRPNRPVRHEFTPYNIVRGSFQPSWGTYSDQSPDDVQVSYLDEDAGFASRDVRAVLPESEGRKPAQKTYLGIVNRNHAHKIGLAYAARNRYRRLSWEFETEGMGRLLNVGDVVSLSHPRLRDTAYGQVCGWREDTLTILTTGKIRTENAEGNLYVSLTRRDGAPWGPVKLSNWSTSSMTFDPEDYALLITQGQGSPFDWLTGGEDRQATVWTLHAAREYSRRAIIKNVVPVSLYRHKIVCMNDHPGIDDFMSIATPPWEHRSALPETQELTAPQALRGHIGGTSAAPILIASWLPVKSAQSYLVEVSTDGLTWASAGRTTVNAFEAPVVVGNVWVRVCAQRQDEQSPWASWHGDTTITVPAAPAPELIQPYTGARLSIAWPRVSGDPSYVVHIVPDAMTAPVRTAPLAQTDYIYTPVLGVDDDGPWRKMRVDVFAVNAAGESPAGSVAVYDAPPAVIGSFQGVVSAASVKLSGVTVTGEHTGFVLVRGLTPDFDAAGIAESRVVGSLPYTWDGLTPTAQYHFRIAAKDAFFDVSGDFASLIYSDVITITTLAG
ncbi:MAG: phage tail protein [Desulfovibrio sp.]|uniref:host specificity factor TipJ family phage tail protein n=1 Tax=Desulfovibrio sp. TaxID=885 RepID=UPI0039E2316B